MAKTATAGATAESAKNLKANERKWGKPLMEAGWTVIPNTLIERQAALGLDPMDLNILLHLFSKWWSADELPFLSKKTIATAIGVTPRTVQRHIARLEKGGLIERVRRNGPSKGTQTNKYRFTKLIKEATPFALQSLQERKRKKQARDDLAGSKGRPRLQVVSND